MLRARASIGTANLLGLEKGKNAVEPTTAYLLLERGCSGKCIFCLQGKGENSKVSRVEWPQYEVDELGPLLQDSNFDRICIQTSIYPELENDQVYYVIEKIRQFVRGKTIPANILDNRV